MLEHLDVINSMDNIINLQADFLGSKCVKSRKSLGQYFTGGIVSHYMASLIQFPKSKELRLLDAGAGTGILTASTAMQCLENGCKSIHAVLYEIDSEAIPLLEQTLAVVQNIFSDHGGSFTYEIRCEDFILARPDKDKNIQSFDVSVINPPYFKYSVKTSPYSKATADLYRGDPNIYASFLAVVLACLNNNGQMVAITPRSFTNGLYFKDFRNYLLQEASLDLIHIFKHRNKVFKNKESDVLQENVICRFIKGKATKKIIIRSSDCDASIDHAEEHKYPADFIIDSSNEQNILRIPATFHEANILKQAEILESTFEGSGYFISTGPVVEHRTRQYIIEDTAFINSVPLYRPHNVTPLTALWSGANKKDVSFKLTANHEKHTIKNSNFVLLKRFSSKDEKRRLVAGAYIASHYDCEYIGFGNKINYIGVRDNKLSIIEAYGLSAVFNSTFMDQYFRCISGNTQVNATEIRIMKFPSREQVKEIGKNAQRLKKYDITELDKILNSILGVQHNNSRKIN